MKICFVTSTRADFGLLKNVILKLKREKKFSTKLIASGTHFSKKFGSTFEEINQNKISIDNRININNILYSPESVTNTMAKCLSESNKIFKKMRPDLLIVLGDRYEILAFALSAYILRIPIAHIHGGEVTKGVLDDAFRHSITKLSHFHFVANNTYKKRVIQLGENSKHVHVVGGLGADSIFQTKFLTKKEIEKKYKIKLKKNYFLVNIQPEAVSKNKIKKNTKILLSAIKSKRDANFIFTFPGADVGNDVIIQEINKFVKKNNNFFLFKSLGQKNYFSFLKYSSGMIGNSSSGLLEMPYFRKGTINIGERQAGRLYSKSVINVKFNKIEIQKTIEKLLTKKFLRKIQQINSPYGRPGASTKIVRILKRKKIRNIYKKEFFDIDTH